MTPRSSIHTHTTYADGRDMPEDMLQAALWLGFHTLGFSEHGHADYDDCSMPAEVEPVYETFEGWKTDITKVRKYEDLPANAKKYLERMAEVTGIALGIVSVGPNRDETIVIADDIF